MFAVFTVKNRTISEGVHKRNKFEMKNCRIYALNHRKRTQNVALP